MSYTKEDLSCRQSWLILGYIRNYRIKQIGEVWIAWTECCVVVYRAVGINDDETRDARDAPVAAQFLILLFSACDKLCPLRFVLFQFVPPCLFVVVDRDADELYSVIVFIMSDMFFKIRNFSTAWSAPSSPKVYIQIFPFSNKIR